MKNMLIGTEKTTDRPENLLFWCWNDIIQGKRTSLSVKWRPSFKWDWKRSIMEKQ